ncbi:MAG: AAA family ATPase, partial [Myxococcota bacterium]
DILGTNVIVEGDGGQKEYELMKGPIFANLVMADEINRAIPKTQSALLEAMQERSVTIFRDTHLLTRPFLVMATQNPIEQEGTYPLPEAQLDRFLFKLHVPQPTREDMHTILEQTTGTVAIRTQAVLSGDRIMEMQSLIREVEVDRLRRDYAIRLVEATHPEAHSAPEVIRRYVRFGSSPRGAQAILLGAKVRALSDARFAVSSDDIRYVAKLALRHRLILSFEGEADKDVTHDSILEGLLEAIPEMEA